MPEDQPGARPADETQHLPDAAAPPEAGPPADLIPPPPPPLAELAAPPDAEPTSILPAETVGPAAEPSLSAPELGAPGQPDQETVAPEGPPDAGVAAAWAIAPWAQEPAPPAPPAAPPDLALPPLPEPLPPPDLASPPFPERPATFPPSLDFADWPVTMDPLPAPPTSVDPAPPMYPPPAPPLGGTTPLPPGGYPAPPNPYGEPQPTQQLGAAPPAVAPYGDYGTSPPPPPYSGYGATPGGYAGYGAAPAPAVNGLVTGAMICGILGLVLSCLFPLVGVILDVVALVLVWQYNNTRRQNPHQPVHPSEGTYIRVAQITAIIGLALIAISCLILVFFLFVASIPSTVP